MEEGFEDYEISGMWRSGGKGIHMDEFKAYRLHDFYASHFIKNIHTSCSVQIIACAKRGRVKRQTSRRAREHRPKRSGARPSGSLHCWLFRRFQVKALGAD